MKPKIVKIKPVRRAGVLCGGVRLWFVVFGCLIASTVALAKRFVQPMP
jgi:hypothetical protein